ncbi:SDR family NAD-dependent epimerase/dehydratase, partial [Klebsiella pneumoniae]
METPSHITEPVNLGNPDEFSIKQLAEKIIANIGSYSQIVYQPALSDDPMQRKPDITKAQNIL